MLFFFLLNRDIAQTCRRIIRVQFFLTILKILVQLKEFPVAEGNLFTGSLGTTARIESEKERVVVRVEPASTAIC